MSIDTIGGDQSANKTSSSGGNFMSGFFKDVEIVKQNIVIIKNATKRVADINQQVVLATTSEREHDVSGELQPILIETNKKAAQAKAFLQALRDETEKLKTDATSKQSEIRIRDNLVNTLTRKFVEVMKEYQNIQTKYKDDAKKKVRRQVQIVKPDATQEEIDSVIKSGSGSDELFRQAILKGDAADAITNAYKNVADKYQDILTLEASMAELHQMFLDFALLTEQQGELLDHIAYQVQQAADYVDDGNVNLVGAIELQKSIRRKQCCIIVTIFVIIGIIIAVVIATQSAKGKL